MYYIIKHIRSQDRGNVYVYTLYERLCFVIENTKIWFVIKDLIKMLYSEVEHSPPASSFNINC